MNVLSIRPPDKKEKPGREREELTAKRSASGAALSVEKFPDFPENQIVYQTVASGTHNRISQIEMCWNFGDMTRIRRSIRDRVPRKFGICPHTQLIFPLFWLIFPTT